MQTKLTNNSSNKYGSDTETIKDYDIEPLINLKHLLYTNFPQNRFHTVFTITIPIEKYEQIQDKLNHFITSIKKTIRFSKVKYLAVVELPLFRFSNYARIIVVMNVGIYEFTKAGLTKTISYRELEEYFRKLWGDDVNITSYETDKILHYFKCAYLQSVYSPFYKNNPTITFQGRVKQPRALLYKKIKSIIKSKARSLLNFSKD